MTGKREKPAAKIGRARPSRWPLALMLVVLTPAALAQNTPKQPGVGGHAKRTLTITVPTEGEYFVRFLPSPDAKEPDQLPFRFLDRKTTVEYDPSEIGKAARIAVDDARTGDTAIRPLSGKDAPAAGLLDLRKADFDHVRQMDVHVLYKGDPVAAARVTLTPRTGPSVTRVLDPAKKGTATFEDVPMGRARIAVVYGDNLTQTQDLDIIGDRPPGILSVTVPVASAVPVVAGVSKGGSPDAGPNAHPANEEKAAPPSAVPPQSGGLIGWLGNLLGLAIAAGTIYLLYRWAKSGGMAATLQKAGIEVSGPTEGDQTAAPWAPQHPTTPAVTDPTVCEFCGEKKDSAGRCACSALPTGGAGAAVAPAGLTSAGQPRLVGTVGTYAGRVFPIGSGVTIGREPANDMPLPDDATVSRRHATVRVEGDGLVVTDENSSNGVYVNGVRISGSATVRLGDEIQIGNTRFRFEV